MRWAPFVPTVMALPALFQAQMTNTSRTGVPIETEAREFMAGYAEDIRLGRRRAIADRYDKRGAYRVGEGEKVLEPKELILAAYLTQWTPPVTFDWQNLSYETLSDDAIIVVGLFDWGLLDGRKLSFSYTGLLVRQDDALRIRLEAESMSPKAFVALNAKPQKS
ncbi:MAG: hypothetical protein ABI681_00855 [Gemmatimonadales bacterium]